MRSHLLLYVPANVHGLFSVAAQLGEHYLLASVVLAVHLFVYLSFILVYQAVGSCHYSFCRAVVLLQFEEQATLILLLEVEDIVNVCTTKTIDALGIISHHANILMRGSEKVDYLLLSVVGVLILIYEDEAEKAGILLAHLLMVSQQQVGVVEQVVEIHRITHAATLAVHVVEQPHLRHLRFTVASLELGTLLVFRRTYEVVLRVGYAVVYLGRLVYLLVELQFLYDSLTERARVRLIVDGIVVGVVYLLSLCPEQLGKDGVEGAHPYVSCPVAYQSYDALLHLLCSLVSEGQSEYLPRLYVLGEQVGYLVGQYPRLA